MQLMEYTKQKNFNIEVLTRVFYLDVNSSVPSFNSFSILAFLTLAKNFSCINHHTKLQQCYFNSQQSFTTNFRL